MNQVLPADVYRMRFIDNHDTDNFACLSIKFMKFILL